MKPAISTVVNGRATDEGLWDWMLDEEEIAVLRSAGGPERTLGGPGSGNFDHAGRPGSIGGSASSSESGPFSHGSGWQTPDKGKRSVTPEVGYHSTDAANIETIARDGLTAFGAHAGDTRTVSFSDSLVNPNDGRSVVLRARIPKDATVYDDKEVREMTVEPEYPGQFEPSIGGPNDRIGEGTAFMLPRSVPPEDLEVIDPKTGKATPLLKYRAGGGPGSGNFGHSGRPGQVGGSSSEGGTIERNEKGEGAVFIGYMEGFEDEPIPMYNIDRADQSGDHGSSVTEETLRERGIPFKKPDEFTFPHASSSSKEHYYHATPRKNLENIRRQGLQPKDSGVSLAADIKNAAFWRDIFAEKTDKQDFALLRMPRGAVRTNTLTEPVFTSASSTSKPIGSNVLEVYRNGKWEKLRAGVYDEKGRWIAPAQKRISDRPAGPWSHNRMAADRRQETAIHKAADKHVEPLHRIFGPALKAARAKVNFKRLRGLVEAGDKSGAKRAVSQIVPALAVRAKKGLEEALLNAALDGAAVGAEMVPQLRTAAVFDYKFKRDNEAMQEFAKMHAGRLVTDISETTRKEIAAALASVFEEDGDLDEMEARISAAVDDEDRGYLIARNESIMMANEGQRMSWRTAAEEGFLDDDMEREWITVGVGVCDMCEEMEGKRAPLDGEYPDPGGDGPTLHVNCRCTEGLAAKRRRRRR